MKEKVVRGEVSTTEIHYSWADPVCRRLRLPAPVKWLLLGVLVALSLGGVGPKQVDLLERVGSWPGFGRGPAGDVAVADGYAYVALGEGGLLVLDVRDPAKPVRVGSYRTPGRTQFVRVVGSRAYLATSVHRGAGCEQEGWRGVLVVLDLSDPTSPAQLGTYATYGEIKALVVDGSRAYLSSENEGFQILDVSEAAKPAQLGVEPTDVSALSVSGQLLYASVNKGGFGELLLFDISRPASPTFVTNVASDIYGPFRGLEVVGNRLYAVQGEFGYSYGSLSIYDISSGTTPVSVGALWFANGLSNLQVVGDRAYLAAGNGGLQVVDVSDAANPRDLGGCDTPGWASQICVEGTNALVADYYCGLQVIDVHDPGQLRLVASYDTGLTARSVRTSEGRAYLLSSDTSPFTVDSQSRVEIVDIQNPTRPVLLGRYERPTGFTSLDLAGNYLYLGCASGSTNPSLQILDASDAAAPVLLAETSININYASHVGVAVCGNYAVVVDNGDDGGLQIFDVSDPSQPVWLSGVTARDGAVCVLGRRAYLGNSTGLDVFDISVPTAPVFMGSIGIPQQSSGSANALHVFGDYAYSGVEWQGFYVTDIRDPTNLVVSGFYDTAGEVQAVRVQDQYAFVAEGWEGLEVFDISVAAQPLPIGRAATWGQARGVYVSGNYVHVAEAGGGLAIFSLPSGSVTIFEEPATVSVAAGDRVSFSVGVYGRGPFTYQWYLGESGDTSHPISGANGAIFTSETLAGPMTCWVRVTSAAGVADSRTAWANVVPRTSVELVGLWPGYRRGEAQDIKVAGTLGYLIISGTLEIFDLSDPSSPRLVGNYSVSPQPSYARLTLSGNLAFLAAYDYGLHIIDVSDPSAPIEIGSETNLYASAVAVAGNYAYIVGGQVRVLDITDPTRPRVVGTNTVYGDDIEVAGQYAYVAGYDPGLHVIDISNPTLPVRVGGFDTGGSATGISVVGDYAYVADGHQGLQILSLANPYFPSLVGGIIVKTNWYARDVFVSGAYAYVAYDSGGLQIIDVSTPAAPLRVGSLDTAYAGAVTVLGSRAYVAAGSGGLAIVDATIPASPTLAGSINTFSFGYGMDVSVAGSYAYLAGGDYGLQILDVADPARPARVDSFCTMPPTRLVAAYGGRLYAGGGAMQVLDLTNPAQPVLLGELGDYTGDGDIAINGDYLYFGGVSLSVVDVRDPAAPTLIGTYALPWLDQYPWLARNTARGISLDGNLAMVGCEWDGLQILDLSIPAQPSRVGAYYSDGPVWGVALDRDLAYLTLGSQYSEGSSLEIVDVGNPSRPARVALIPMSNANRVRLMGSYACVTGDGLAVVDVADLYHPVRAGQHRLGDNSTSGLQVVGDLVYVAAGDYGLAIYRVTPQLRLNQPVIDARGIHLSWLGAPGIRLQRATRLSPPDWQDVPGTEGLSKAELSFTGPVGFYRLMKR